MNSGQSPLLYNIRIIKTYVEYLEKFYPDLDVDEILTQVGISRYQLDDPGVWYSQETSDQFHKILNLKTHNANISRDSGRYVVSSNAYRFVRQYIYGCIIPRTAYTLLPRIHSKVSKASSISVKSISQNKIEVTAAPRPGVREKPYQCQNRLGQFEALAATFTGQHATVEHPYCLHKGDPACVYYITWVEPLFLKIRRWRNVVLVLSFIVMTSLSFILGHTQNIILASSLLGVLASMTCIGWYFEKESFKGQVENQSQTAELLMLESNMRNTETNLVQEIGQAISSELDIDKLLATIMSTLQHRLDYDRGVVFLSNEDHTRLLYKAGYGFNEDQASFIQKMDFHLNNPDSKGPFVVAFRERKPILVDQTSTVSNDLSRRSQDFLVLSGSTSFICVPIVFKGQSLGVLSVDRVHSDVPLKKSDLDMLSGITPQIAISINNARTFERLLNSEEQYRDLVEGTNSIILRLDTKGNITFANKFAQDFFGYPDQEMLHHNVTALISPETNDMDGIQRYLSDPERYMAVESEHIRKDGRKVWVSWSNKAIRNPLGNIVEVRCVGNDITARKTAEEENRQLEDQLVRAQKMEAIGALAGGVAHDLNNILSGLTSYPDLLLIDMPEDAPYRKALMTIKRSGERAAAIVQDLLTLARRGVSISNPVDLNQIIQDYFESPEYLKMHSFHADVNFITRLDPDIKPILGSETHLMKTIMNLVNNAAEALPDKGTVTVSTSSVYMDRTIKGDGKVPAGEYVMLTVSDNGIGIPEEDQQKIFEPFYTKKKMGKSGTGLGMTVVWSTVKDHKGYIEIESGEGTGTTFNIYFPVTRKKLKESGIDRIDMYQGSERVMVVDDEEYQRDLTMEVLSRLGYQVDAASSGEEALEKMQSRPADLLILDMMMDGIDGLDTYKGALELQRKQKALIVSGYSETDRVKEALRLGAGGYIKKPYALQDFARAVRRELDKKVH